MMAEMLNSESESTPADHDQVIVYDPALRQFLQLLARDIEENPQRLQAISSDLMRRVQSLMSGVEINLDAPLLDQDE
jgi:hypothetical protein